MKHENPGAVAVLRDSVVSLPSVVIPLVGGAAFWGLVGAAHHLTDMFVKNEYANPIVKIASDILLATAGAYAVANIDEFESDFSKSLKNAAIGATASASFRTIFDMTGLVLPTTGFGKTVRQWADLPKTRNLLAPAQAGKSSGDKGAGKSLDKAKVGGQAADLLLRQATAAASGDANAMKQAGFMDVWLDGKKVLELINVGYNNADGPFFYEDKAGTKVISEDDVEVGRNSQGGEFYFVEEDGKKYILAYKGTDGATYPIPSLRLNKANFIDNGMYKQWEAADLFTTGTEPSKQMPSTTAGYEVWDAQLGAYRPAITHHQLGNYDPAIEAHQLQGYEEWNPQLGNYDPAITPHQLGGYYDFNPTQIGY